MQLTKICWHLIAPSSTPDLLGKVGLNLALGMVTSCCHCQTACFRPTGCWLGRGSTSIGDPSKGHEGLVTLSYYWTSSFVEF